MHISIESDDHLFDGIDICLFAVEFEWEILRIEKY